MQELASAPREHPELQSRSCFSFRLRARRWRRGQVQADFRPAEENANTPEWPTVMIRSARVRGHSRRGRKRPAPPWEGAFGARSKDEQSRLAISTHWQHLAAPNRVTELLAQHQHARKGIRKEMREGAPVYGPRSDRVPATGAEKRIERRERLVRAVETKCAGHAVRQSQLSQRQRADGTRRQAADERARWLRRESKLGALQNGAIVAQLAKHLRLNHRAASSTAGAREAARATQHADAVQPIGARARNRPCPTERNVQRADIASEPETPERSFALLSKSKGECGGRAIALADSTGILRVDLRVGLNSGRGRGSGRGFLCCGGANKFSSDCISREKQLAGKWKWLWPNADQLAIVSSVSENDARPQTEHATLCSDRTCGGADNRLPEI